MKRSMSMRRSKPVPDANDKGLGRTVEIRVVEEIVDVGPPAILKDFNFAT